MVEQLAAQIINETVDLGGKVAKIGKILFFII
jgi:hypothetical protein